MPEIWKRCPKCGSDSLGADYLDTLHTIGYRRVFCLDCHFEWQEVYELSHVEDDDGYTLNYKGEIIEP